MFAHSWRFPGKRASEWTCDYTPNYLPIPEQTWTSKSQPKLSLGSSANFSFNSSTKLHSVKAGTGPIQNPQKYDFNNSKIVTRVENDKSIAFYLQGLKFWGRIIYFHVTKPSKILNQISIGFSRVLVFRSETDIGPNAIQWLLLAASWMAYSQEICWDYIRRNVDRIKRTNVIGVMMKVWLTGTWKSISLSLWVRSPRPDKEKSFQ